jgi:hypothetical protein
MAVVLLPTPPFWFTMATTVFIAGILARGLQVLLNRQVVSWPLHLPGGDTARVSP